MPRILVGMIFGYHAYNIPAPYYPQEEIQMASLADFPALKVPAETGSVLVLLDGQHNV